jgi:phenylpyruvate tautomerase
MPLLKIQTNAVLDAEAGRKLVAEASRAVATLLGKPERYVMVALEPVATMAFAGDASPLAYLEMKSVGLPQGRTAALSKALCDLMSTRLGVPLDRIYIEFADAQGALWGWNGGTF